MNFDLTSEVPHLDPHNYIISTIMKYAEKIMVATWHVTRYSVAGYHVNHKW